MATDIYHVGSDGSKIYLSVEVSTPGIADTKAQFVIGATVTDLPGCSCDAAGNLNSCLVGVDTDLDGKNLIVSTAIDLVTVDPVLWPTMYNSLVIKYIVSGGSDLVQQYAYAPADKATDATGQFIIVHKPINLAK